MKVLVTDPFSRNSLAIARALDAEGVRVDCLGWRDAAGRAVGGQTFWSRACRDRYYARDSFEGAEDFIGDVLDVLEGGGYDVILPVGHKTVIPIARHSDAIRSLAGFPFPDYELVGLAHDKERLLSLADAEGIGVPESIVARGADDVVEFGERVGYPVVIKPRKGSGSRGMSVASDADGAQEAFRGLHEGDGPDRTGLCRDNTRPLIQELIPGPLFDVGFLADEGELVAHVVQKRERTYPASGGSGTLNRTCDQEEVREEATRLIRAIGWHGVGMVEFKLDRDGRPRLMELNPKFWGTVDLSIQAGVNFPYLACLQVTGQPLPDVDYVRDLSYRWIFPESFLTVMTSTDKLAAAWDFYRPFRPDTVSEVRLGDPGPTLYTMGQMILAALGKDFDIA